MTKAKRLPPANVAAYVDVIGTERALALFLALGGSQIYLSLGSGDRSLAARTIGAENVERLAAAMGYGYIKVPLARQWIAETLRDAGKSYNEIARVVRADVATVRKWLGPQAPEQFSLPI